MVNSGSFDSADGNRNGKTRCTQAGDAAIGSQTSGSDDAACKSGCSKSADGDLPSDESAIEPTPTKTEINSNMPSDALLKNEFAANDGKSTACCSLPIEKTQSVTNSNSSIDNFEDKAKHTRKLLCLYCDRSFVSANLRQKHVERVHSVKPTRRVSARRQNQLSTTPCVHCDKLNLSETTLNDLFQHLIQEHSAKYFGCLSCEERFLTSIHLADHNKSKHFVEEPSLNTTASQIGDVTHSFSGTYNVSQKVTRSKLRNKVEEPLDVEENSSLIKRKKKSKLKELRNKKISVKTSKIAIKRSKRLQQQAKEHESQKKRRDKKLPNTTKPEATSSSKQPEKSRPSCVNPYPEFDSFYRVKKITDHSIDNLKISSLTFDDVFDKAFFNRIKCNIEENLLHHIDGKLFKNEESESRISNFEKIFTATQEVQNSNADNYGCELSLNAITPAPALSLSSQFGEDFESQIEYGSKPSKKKNQIKNDEVHYKYFTRRKYQASILQQKENRDLSKLDMWTQMVVKERQERVLNKKKSAKEIQEYISGQEYKSKIKRQELNRILDRRGPFEDLKEEASKKAAFDKLNNSSDSDISQEVFTDVREVLNELLNRVFEAVEEENGPPETSFKEIDQREIPAYLDLRRKTSSTQEEIDKSDKIALICSSQETENFELPTNAVRGKNELVELTGEWARSRMYICAACGGKFSNMKYLLEHKSLYHQNVWVQHYEFVGNQSELYRHLSIPGLGKVGIVEDTVPCKLWKRSDARTCTKCGKQCNTLGELHRHVLECGGDWTWMLARKKCKYRPYGAKSRRKRRGFEPKIQNKRKTEPSEKKIYKKPVDGPRQRPSDADTIQRMLANLPAKRSRRSIISLSDVVFKSRKTNNRAVAKTTKVKRSKSLHNKQQKDPGKSTSSQQRTNRALRSLNKVLSSRILDLNSSLLVKRKMKVMRSQRLTRNAFQAKNIGSVDDSSVESEFATLQTQKKRKSPKKDNSNLEESKVLAANSTSKNKSVAKRMLTSHLNLKNFFQVKKKSLRTVQDNSNSDKVSAENEANIESNKKSKYLENFQHIKENKRGGLKGFVRALSLRKRNSNREECLAIADTKNFKDEQAKSETGKKSSRSKTKQILPLENPEQGITQPPSKSEVLSKKRKLQRSFRNVMNKVKKIKSERNSNKSIEIVHERNGNEENESQPFLDEAALQNTLLEKVVILAEVKENVQEKEDHAPIVGNLTDTKENHPIPETVFNLGNNEENSLQAKGELDFDAKQSDLTDTTFHSSNLPITRKDLDIKTGPPSLDFDSKTTPVAIDTSLKPKCVPLVSPNLKGKIRKPSRGLNDCIAMLTSKLQQKEEKISSSLESLFSTSSTTSIEPRAESRPLLDSIPASIKIPELGNIPKIPVFSVSKSPVIEETALDLSKKSFSTPDLFSNNQDRSVNGNILENIEKGILNEKLVASSWTSVDDIIQQVVQNSAAYVFSKPKKNIFTKSNVDDTIDFVVNSSLDWFENKHINTYEKLKHYKKSRRKKHSDDNLITNILFGKDKLIIAPSSNSKRDLEDPLIAKIKENEYKMSHSQHILEKASLVPDILKIPFVHPSDKLLSVITDTVIEKDNTPIVPLCTKEINEANSQQLTEPENLQQDVEEKSFVKTGSFIETKEKGIELPQNTVQTTSLVKKDENTRESKLRNETRIKRSTSVSPEMESKCATEAEINDLKTANKRRGKLRKSKSQDKPEKSRTLDGYNNFNEVSCDKPDTAVFNVLPISENVIDKKIELNCENTPIILENKIIEPTAKLPSDSEDEVPLAIIAKLDEGRSFLQDTEVSNSTLPVKDKENQNSVLDDCKDLNELPKLLEEPIKKPDDLTDSFSDAKDMLETLTTDSLKENVEETVNKRKTLLNKLAELTTEETKISNINKTIKKKKRKKMFKNRRLSNKKESSVEQNLAFECKANTQESYFVDQDESEITLAERITVMSIKADLPMNKQFSQAETSTDASEGSALSNFESVQPADTENKAPIKLLNSQRTRRKSKSSKKIDKIDNDLFKDFSLVINKKTKRIPPTSIVDDSVCDDILDANINFFVKTPEVSKDADLKNFDIHNDSPLNDSVEEMDMEIEDIPINTSIIERDDKQIATLTSYKGEIPCITENVIQKLNEQKESPAAITNNSSELIDTLNKPGKTDIFKVELNRITSKNDENSTKVLEQDALYLNVSNNVEITTKSLSAFSVDKLKLIENNLDQDLFKTTKNVLPGSIEERLTDNAGELAENIDTVDASDNQGPLILHESVFVTENSSRSSSTEKSLALLNSPKLGPGFEPALSEQVVVIESTLCFKDNSSENTSELKTDICPDLINSSPSSQAREIGTNVGSITSLDSCGEKTPKEQKINYLETKNDLTKGNEFEIPLKESTPLKNAPIQFRSSMAIDNAVTDMNSFNSNIPNVEVSFDDKSSNEVNPSLIVRTSRNRNESAIIYLPVTVDSKEKDVGEIPKTNYSVHVSDVKTQPIEIPTLDLTVDSTDADVNHFEEPIEAFISGKSEKSLVSDLTTHSIESKNSDVPPNIEDLQSLDNGKHLEIYSNGDRNIQLSKAKAESIAPEIHAQDIWNAPSSNDSCTSVDDNITAISKDILEETEPRTCEMIDLSDKKFNRSPERSTSRIIRDEDSGKLIFDLNASRVDVSNETLEKSFKPFSDEKTISQKVRKRTDEDGESNIDFTQEPFENVDDDSDDIFFENASDRLKSSPETSPINLQLSVTEKLTDDSGFIEKLLEESIDKKRITKKSKRDTNKQKNSENADSSVDISNVETSTSHELENSNAQSNIKVLKKTDIDHITPFIDGIGVTVSNIRESVEGADVSSKKTSNKRNVPSKTANEERSSTNSLLIQNKNDIKNVCVNSQLSKTNNADIMIDMVNKSVKSERKFNNAGKTIFGKSTSKSDNSDITSSFLENLDKSVESSGGKIFRNQEPNKPSLLTNTDMEGIVFEENLNILGRRRSSRTKLGLTTNLSTSDKAEDGNNKLIQESQENLESTINVVSENNTQTSPNEIKGRRPRKIINYNEDNLEKIAMEINSKIKCQDVRLTRDVMPQVKKNKKLKKNNEHIDNIVIHLESVVNENSNHKNFNEGLNLSELSNRESGNIELEDLSDDRRTEQHNAKMEDEQIVLPNIKRKKRNKQKLTIINDASKVNSSVQEDSNELSWTSEVGPMVYKISEFSEIPKLVIDIHHVDQIDQKLKEHMLKATMEEREVADLETHQNDQDEKCNLIIPDVKVKNVDVELSNALNMLDFQECTTLSKKHVSNKKFNKNVETSTINVTKVNLPESAYIETNASSSSKQNYFGLHGRPKKQIDWKEKTLQDQTKSNTSTDLKSNVVTDPSIFSSEIKGEKKTKKKSNALASDIIVVEDKISTEFVINNQLEDVVNDNDSQPNVRYNRRSRKNINYNEEVLLNTAESIYSSSVTEKKTRRKSEKSSNLPQNIITAEEKLPSNETVPINEANIEETISNSFDEGKISMSSEFGELNSSIDSQMPTRKSKLKINKNIASTEMRGNITDRENIAEPVKGIFEFEETVSNQENTSTLAKDFDTDMDPMISKVDEMSISEKNVNTKDVEPFQNLEPELVSLLFIEGSDKTNQIESKSSTEVTELSLLTSLNNVEEINSISDDPNIQKYSERRVKKPKKNNMDIDVANILNSDNDSKNRRSPRKRKALNEQELDLSPKSTENSSQEDLTKKNQKNNFIINSKTSFSNKNLITEGILETENETSKPCVLEPLSNMENENQFILHGDLPEKHCSDSNESLSLLERMTEFINKLAVKDNKRNNLTENNLPQNTETSTKAAVEVVDNSKDSLPMISVSSSDDLLKIIDICPVIDDKSISSNLDNLITVSKSENSGGTVLEPKSSPIKNKKRKIKHKLRKIMFCENPDNDEVCEESKTSNTNHSSCEQPGRQYQLAKINIKNLLLSSLAPPDSTYIETDKITAESEEIPLQPNQTSNTASNLEDINSFSEINEDHKTKSSLKCNKPKGKKQKSKHSALTTQDGFQVFDDAIRENNINRHKSSKSVLRKNLTFTALENVLNTFTKSSAKNTFEKSDNVFSEIQPLTEIITSSEMDIAPVLDEIDKSLESDIYDFNDDVHNESVNTEKHKSAKNKSKSESKSSAKSNDGSKDQLMEVDLERESGRRTSNRHAKVKALESIHEKALTESEDYENITSDMQFKRSKKRSKSLCTNKEELVNNEKDSISGNRNNKVDEDNFFTVEDNNAANILSIPIEQCESDLLNEMEVVTNSFSGISENHPKSLEDMKPNDFTSHNQDMNQNINSSEAILSDYNQIDGDGLELRRSRRGSRKVASYNENDLIDPLIDALEKRRNRSCRKDRSAEKYQARNEASKEASNKPKLSSEELFDILKNSSYKNENAIVSKPQNSFFDNLNETSSNGAYHDAIDDDSDNVHESESARKQDPDKIYEFTEESPENSKEIKELFGKNKKKSKQCASVDIKLTSELPTYIENNTSVDDKFPEKEKGKDFEQEKPNYCDICKKSFIRIENLIKHKTTLTHISKLSELEAKEAEERAKLEKQTTQQEHSNSSLKALRDEINITDILQQSERSQVSIPKNSPTLLHNNHSLKLVDIISDVLNKPVLETYSQDKQEFVPPHILTKENNDTRRYKSLGERKSFESESHLSQINNAVSPSYLPPTLCQTKILENQINLLENIIGNNLENITTNKHEPETFIDEISSCSNASNISDLDNPCVNRSVFNINPENIEVNSDADFIKPTQYEEISEDSTSARVYDDPKQRKTLNRDEELFLECCSLLKSGSEVSNSNYSKTIKKPIDNFKEVDESEFLENKKLIQTAEDAHEYSDNSRTPTPLGDTYDDEASNSNTISSNWHLHSERPLDKNRSFSFEEVKSKEATGMTFGEILTKGLRNQFENIAKTDDGSTDSFQDALPDKSLPSDERRDDSDSSSASKKIATKGARKVYEGLKVSIPTEDLNLDVLNTSPLNKMSDMKAVPFLDDNIDQTRAKLRSTRKSKPVKNSQVGSNLLFKVNKKKSSGPITSSALPVKQDIYNFEETQDNTDIFVKPTFKDVKGAIQDVRKDTIISSDNESLGYADSIGADAKSVSSVSSISALSAKKPETAPENITKKKYKIMGKIFRNAAKSKMDDIDEDLRSIPEIPEIDNLELVENYVRSCQRVKSPFMPPPPPPPLYEVSKKPKMTEEEMNMLFDQLKGKEINEAKSEKPTSKSTIIKAKTEPKNGDAKKKTNKVKNRKRARANSESSDDEFNISRTAKKRTNKKNNQEGSGINLELELKECIGVASRKSQRTCTSGKQNVLVEYWSSDEEAFEAMLENHKVSAKKDDKKKVEKKETETTESANIISEALEKPLEKATAKPKPAKKKTQSVKKTKPPNTKEPEVSVTVAAPSNRRKRAAANPLYHWSSSSEDESQSLIEVKPIREEDDEDDRPIQHGWIVGDSPKKLVTMLALTKGKKTDFDSVKEQGKRRTSNVTS